MQDNNKLSFCIAYESGCSGETIATENIIRIFRKSPDVRIYSFHHPRLVQTSLWGIFFWIIHSVLFWLKIFRWLNNIDWIYTTTYTAGVAASLLKLFFPIHIAWHFHGSRIPPMVKSSYGISYFTQLLKHHSILVLHRFFVSKTDIVFVPTQFSKRYLLHEIPNIQSELIECVPDGVDTELFRPITDNKVRQNIRNKLELPSKGLIITSVSILSERKNILLLYHVIQQVRQSFPKLIFLIVFPQPKTVEETGIKRQLEKLIMKDSKTYLIENPPSIVDIYSISTIVVSLTRMEHFSLVLLEALSSKVIFMATPKGEIPSLLNQIEKKLILKEKTINGLSRQIISVIHLPKKKLDAIREKGYRRVLSYTWYHTAQMIKGYFMNLTK